ncbi:HAMP domain-containing sensor histidine kinase [Clostridium sp. UBA7503]|uniref:sensor histidine kinase n=1 Tax=Clostridium sp. UBA7503 TaxID=1946377 RepID=UPI003217CFDB
MKLKHRLTLIFLLFSMTIILLISFSSHIFMKKNFNRYLEDAIAGRKKVLIKNISNTYKNGQWDNKNIESIGLEAINNGFIISIKDISDNVIWSAKTHNSSMCEAMMDKMGYNMSIVNPGYKGDYTEEVYNLKIDDKAAGILEIGYYGPFYYNDSDVIFLKTLDNILIFVGIFSLCISIFIGVLISTSISKPIGSVVKATNFIATGKYKNKIKEESNIKEIKEMISSVNTLANSLDEEEKIRKILTKDISHELRTPLTTMQGQLEALIDGIWEPTEERLQSIHEEVQRLSRLVGSLEHLSRYESEDLILNKSEVNIKNLMEMILINFEKQLHDKNISVNNKSENFIINIDRDKITQALVNIISNGIKYTEFGGIIKITCHKERNITIIHIKDSGIGISKEHLPYIFQRFYRADESRTRATGGAGIGLTISKAIIEAHEGNIKVKSEVNKGTEFIIEIPKV